VTATPSEQREHLALAAELAGLGEVDIALPEARHVVLRGMRLHYVDWGTAGLPPILFLHGGGLTARTWDLVCLALRDSSHCFALDQRGHGDSEWSPGLEYDTAAHVGDIEALIECLALGRPVLVGQSMGALNSLAYAAGHADDVAGLVLVDMTPDVEFEGAQRIFDFVTAPAELDSIEAFVERAVEFNPSRDRRLLRRSLQHNLRRLPSGKWTWKYDRRAMTRERFERVRSEVSGIRDHLGDVTCPTLVVRGERSDVVTEASAVALADALPHGERVTVADAGHTVQGDNPRDLAAAIERFLAGSAPQVGDVRRA
jgi:pimeloyl-ACP methyl ester carboxylesterase